MKDEWHFPLIDSGREKKGLMWPLYHYKIHITEEVKEFNNEVDQDKKDKEAVDVLHAAETFVRYYFKRNGRSFEAVRDAIIAKNKARGYYD